MKRIVSPSPPPRRRPRRPARAAEDAKALFAQKCASLPRRGRQGSDAMGKKLGAKDLSARPRSRSTSS